MLSPKQREMRTMSTGNGFSAPPQLMVDPRLSRTKISMARNSAVTAFQKVCVQTPLKATMILSLVHKGPHLLKRKAKLASEATESESPGDEDGRALGLPGGSVVKNLLANAGDVDSIPGLWWSSGEGNGNPLQCSCLENPRDRGAWQVTVHGVSKSLTQLSHQIALADSQSCPLWGTSHQSLFAYKASLKVICIQRKDASGKSP